jgi:carboxylesterase type B
VTPFSEDCLYLNIFAPNSSSADASGRAVMVYIYGGAFIQGSSANPAFDGRVLAAYGDVILVSINYRVGVLGFLYLNTTDVPGNVGLLDQQLAIQWVHDNIKYFGGDANRITVFGESAGAMSTGLQLLSPLNRGQFYLLEHKHSSIVSCRKVTPLLKWHLQFFNAPGGKSRGFVSQIVIDFSELFGLHPHAWEGGEGGKRGF